MPRTDTGAGFDQTLAFRRKPYDFIAEGCERRGVDVFETRLMLRPTICMLGREAAEVFYDDRRFMRRGAAPLRIQQSLLGHGGVQGLDGERHRHRKKMFLQITAPERTAELLLAVARHWEFAAVRWERAGRIVLYDELHQLLTRAVCEWSGVPLPEADVARRAHQLTAMFDRAGAVGPAHWSARLARRRAERWAAATVAGVRAGRIQPPAASALHVVSWYRDVEGKPLDRHAAAVELLNVLRPTVAVSVYIVFAALALYRHPAIAAAVAREEDDALEHFVQEVRRYHPFFPAAMARVRREFVWHGQRFRRGERVLLDLYGTNHDARTWKSPHEFRPERFADPPADHYDFIPQGGGTHHRHHRCPGEGVTVELMKQAVRFLLHRLSYAVPPQDLEIDRQRLPALPRSGLVISDLRRLRPRYTNPPTP